MRLGPGEVILDVAEVAPNLLVQHRLRGFGPLLDLPPHDRRDGALLKPTSGLGSFRGLVMVDVRVPSH